MTLAVVLSCGFWAFGANAQSPLGDSLTSAFAKLPHRRARASVCVIDLATGSTVFSLQTDLPLVPASAMKVITMAVALSELGPDFQFKTTLATNGRDLIAIGDGDPALGDERLHRRRNETITSDFDRWADTLLGHGITTISGDLVLDESIFDDVRLHPSWEADDLDNWYAAPVGALNFNDNCIDMTVRPGASKGAPAFVSYLPANGLLNIVNQCRTGGKGNPTLHHAYDSFEYRITGGCKKKWKFGPVSFPDPGLLFGASLEAALASKGITLKGKTVRKRVRNPDGNLPRTFDSIGHRTTPIRDVLHRAGKDSQNLFAECLLKRAGYSWAKRVGRDDPQGSWTLGAQSVSELFEWADIDRKGLRVSDGSGLSRENLCTTRQLAALLAWTHRRPEGRVMYDSLAIAAEDGSMRRRLKDLPGRVRAKTGTMTGICALAGYVDGQQGPRFAFAVIFNGYKGPSTPYRKIQDKLCRILAAEASAPALGSR